MHTRKLCPAGLLVVEQLRSRELAGGVADARVEVCGRGAAGLIDKYWKHRGPNAHAADLVTVELGERHVDGGGRGFADRGLQEVGEP